MYHVNQVRLDLSLKLPLPLVSELLIYSVATPSMAARLIRLILKVPRRGNFITPTMMSAQPQLLKYANDNVYRNYVANYTPSPYIFAQLTLFC